jgi:hypothetical protein
MTNLSRRGLFGIIGGGLLASAAPQDLFWHQSPLNVSYIMETLEERLNAWLERADFKYSAQEVEAVKAAGGWPEYGTPTGKPKYDPAIMDREPVKRLLPDNLRSNVVT